MTSKVYLTARKRDGSSVICAPTWRLITSFCTLAKKQLLKKKRKTNDISFYDIIRLVMAGSKMCASSFNIHQVIENLEIKKKMTGKEIVNRVLKVTSAQPVLSGPPPC